LIATTANDTDLWFAVALSRADAVETRVESLWASCEVAAHRLWRPEHNILGCAVKDIFAFRGHFDRYRHSHDMRNLLFCIE
jgi:hypothetical protein